MMATASILLVEDTPDIAQYIRDILVGAGWSVQHEERAARGLAAAKGGAFDILVCDRMLPDGEGLDLVESLQENVLLERLRFLRQLTQT